MKNLLFTIVLLFSLKVQSQENVHWLINKDSIADCNFIKSGTFVNEETDSKITLGYSIEFRDTFVIEKVEDGKYFLKSTIKYTSQCSYEITVIENTIPGSEDLIGTTFYTEILETAISDNLVKIRSKDIDKEWIVFVLRKIED